MQTLTIPQKITKQGELILIPRRDYDRLLARSKPVSELDKRLALALEEVRQGKVYGPFSTAAEGIAFLRSQRKK